MDHNLNITRIKAVYNAFRELRDEVVFTGGATVSLYADREVLEPRPTDDVDVIVEISSYIERSRLEEKLRDLGFFNDVHSGIICRYQVSGLIVDIMPTNDPTIGFNNPWYEDGFKHSVLHEIDDRHKVRILSGPYFIASKLEAFKNRGNNDGRTSHDFEDIIFILEQRSSIISEMNQCEPDLKKYLIKEFMTLLDNPQIFEWIDSHTERGPIRSTRRIMDSLLSFIQQ